MNGSVGPLTTAPPTTGRDARRPAPARARSAARMPGTARIGPIEITGFDGPIDDRAARRRSPRAPRAAAAPPRRPRTRRPSTGPAPRSRIMNSWKSPQRPRASTRVRTGASPIGSTRAADAERAPRARRAPRSAARPRRSRSRPAQPDREVAVAEVEPHVDAELAQPVHHVERVAAQAPAALVDAVGEPERDEVGVGRDVARRRSRRRRRCWRRRRGRRPRRRACPRASFAPPVPPARTTTGARPISSPVILMPGVGLVPRR